MSIPLDNRATENGYIGWSELTNITNFSTYSLSIGKGRLSMRAQKRSKGSYYFKIFKTSLNFHALNTRKITQFIEEIESYTDSREIALLSEEEKTRTVLKLDTLARIGLLNKSPEPKHEIIAILEKFVALLKEANPHPMGARRESLSASMRTHYQRNPLADIQDKEPENPNVEQLGLEYGKHHLWTEIALRAAAKRKGQEYLNSALTPPKLGPSTPTISPVSSEPPSSLSAIPKVQEGQVAETKSQAKPPTSAQLFAERISKNATLQSEIYMYQKEILSIRHKLKELGITRGSPEQEYDLDPYRLINEQIRGKSPDKIKAYLQSQLTTQGIKKITVDSQKMAEWEEKEQMHSNMAKIFLGISLNAHSSKSFYERKLNKFQEEFPGLPEERMKEEAIEKEKLLLEEVGQLKQQREQLLEKLLLVNIFNLYLSV